MDPDTPSIKITSIDGLTPPENVPISVAIEEGSPEEQRQVKALYENIQQLFVGIDHIVIAKTIGVYMATLMCITDRWKDLIPGFMNQMDMAANLAINYHERKEDGSQDQQSEQSEGSEATPGGDSDLEVKEG